MLSREDNALLTRVARGTSIGDTMQRYWIPALLAWELPEPDGPPVPVRLLGEDARVPCPARPSKAGPARATGPEERSVRRLREPVHHDPEGTTFVAEPQP